MFMIHVSCSFLFLPWIFRLSFLICIVSIYWSVGLFCYLHVIWNAWITQICIVLLMKLLWLSTGIWIWVSSCWSAGKCVRTSYITMSLKYIIVIILLFFCKRALGIYFKILQTSHTYFRVASYCTVHCNFDTSHLSVEGVSTSTKPADASRMPRSI